MTDDTINSEAAAADRRQRRRQRVVKGGRMVFGGYASTIDCQIRNITEQGARLTVASTVGLPEEFHLLMVDDRRMAPARIVWRKERDLGVVFTGPFALQAR